MTFRVLSNSLSRFLRMLLTFAVVCMICGVVDVADIDIDVAVIFYLLIVQLRRDAAWLRSSTNGLYLFEGDAADVTDFDVVIHFFLSKVDTCHCGMEETPQHIIEVCRFFEEERQRLRSCIQEMELTWPKEKWEFITKDVYPHLQKFTKSALLAKEQKRKAALQDTKGPLQQGRPPARRQTEEQSDQPPRRSAMKAQQAREEKSGEPTEPQQQP
jgi:hypothetical protein